MNALTISSFLVLLVIVSGIIVTPSAYADIRPEHVSVVPGSGVPGCEDTDECYTPTDTTVSVGTTVTWSNDDTAAHTVTSGTPEGGPDGNFDSSLFMAGNTYEVTFDTAGVYDYFCMVHPWMIGSVTVQEAMAEEDKGEMMGEAMMSGVNLDLEIDPMLPFDNTANDRITLSFTAKSDALKGSGAIDHLDYKIVISKDGNEVWSDQFHDHDGNLELQVTPSEGSFTTTGGQEDGTSSTGPFMVQGPIFMDNGSYEISGQIVGIEFNPLQTPLTDDFNIQVVPEFGSIVMVAFAIAIVSVVLTTKSRVMPKL